MNTANRMQTERKKRGFFILGNDKILSLEAHFKAIKNVAALHHIHFWTKKSLGESNHVLHQDVTNRQRTESLIPKNTGPAVFQLCLWGAFNYLSNLT